MNVFSLEQVGKCIPQVWKKGPFPPRFFVCATKDIKCNPLHRLKNSSLLTPLCAHLPCTHIRTNFLLGQVVAPERHRMEDSIGKTTGLGQMVWVLAIPTIYLMFGVGSLRSKKNASIVHALLRQTQIVWTEEVTELVLKRLHDEKRI